MPRPVGGVETIGIPPLTAPTRTSDAAVPPLPPLKDAHAPPPPLAAGSSAPPPRHTSPPTPRSTAVAGHTAGDAPAPGTPITPHHAGMIPPLPPIASYSNSPAATQQAQIIAASKRASNSATNLHAQSLSHGGGAVDLKGTDLSSTPLRIPVSASPLLHFQPRPNSPTSISLSASSPSLLPLGSLPNGTVCTCRNDPADPKPCNCSVPGGVLPLTPQMRPLSQSSSMDGFTPSRSTSFGGPILSQSPPPYSSHRRPASIARSLTSTLSSAGSSVGSSLASGGGVFSSSSPSHGNSSSIASIGMAHPSQLPTSHGNVVINIYSGQPHQLQPPAPSPSRHVAPQVLRRSILSPTAPPDVLALMQRQASVSPAYSPSPPPSASAAGAVGSTAAAAASAAKHTTTTTIRIHAAESPESPKASASGLPLTESTLRLLRKAMEAVRSLFPLGDSAATASVEAPSCAVAAPPPMAQSSCCSPAASCASCMVRMRSSQQLWSLQDRSGAVPPSLPQTNVSSAASASGCSCFTRPLLCGCGHNLHRSDTAPSFTFDNPHLRLGYRGVLTPSECIRSLGQLHNESCNVWSHLLGSAWMASLWRKSRGDPALQLHSATSTMLFGCSAIAHLFAPVSADCNATLFRLDRCSISLTETGLGISTALIHFDRPDQSRLRWSVASLNVLLGLAAFRMLWTENAHSSRLAKVGVLVGQAVVFSFPALRELFLTKDRMLKGIIRKYAILAASTGLVGALFYASFFPERFVYQREVKENSRRHRESQSNIAAAVAAGGVATPGVTPGATPVSPCSTPSSPSARSYPPLPPHLLSSPLWRWIHWMTNHFFHSHHLMHLSVVASTYFAWVLCAKWRGRKLQLAASAAAAATAAIAQSST